jgi:hypothetical protein
MDHHLRAPPPKNVDRGIYEYVDRSRYNSLKLIQKRYVTLSRLGSRLVRVLESSVHKSAYSGPISMIPSEKWVCYVLPIHVACSIMQIGPLVPKIQQVTGLRGR